MPFYAGFALGLGLIVAIGAQNAFVLRQGLADRYVLAVCLCCTLSDVVLIGAGVAGVGALARAHSDWIAAFRYAGAAFLVVYAAASLRRALGSGAALAAGAEPAASLSRTLAICLALTWLNPHVYLDTLILLGTVAATYGDERIVFGLGAISASFVFFFTLGFGARRLRGLFARPATWRIVDAAVAVLMAVLAARLIV
ncbi:LysE/ArgO family amino acid transporter [Salinisphaera sp.]|uniref:LysE/ArgO family amino acid transporter n=1 Tax=Salinisphaera sp. TaxID=1914330 RepID=UPI002D77D3F9|nr:LysE/ArgO family amino acid transporter [Salinisphaera sp.]HET7314310.1 LysE/ArgO family amino acid transporter [Salinisphaera sp.]